MTAIQKLLNDIVNGNNREARCRAHHIHAYKIREALVSELGYSLNKAVLTTDWLKGRDCWQAACDAK